MSSIRGLVADTITFSNVDGPGNRFVVFLQGCNFDCIACHNPYTIDVCTGCGECVTACRWGALTMPVVIGADPAVRWDPLRCHGDDACIAACPIDATPKARWASVPELMTPIRRAAPFLSGVTVSGGEATQQPGFVRALFEAVRHDPATFGLTCFVDSNGSAPRAVWDDLLEVMDGAMIDLKCLDPGIHQQMTGQSNEPVLDTIRYLHDQRRLDEVRLLIVAGVNDDPAVLRRTAQWLAEVDPQMRLRIIGFRRHGVRPHVPELIEPTSAQMEDVVAIFRAIAPFDACLI